MDTAKLVPHYVDIPYETLVEAIKEGFIRPVATTPDRHNCYTYVCPFCPMFTLIDINNIPKCAAVVNVNLRKFYKQLREDIPEEFV